MFRNCFCQKTENSIKNLCFLFVKKINFLFFYFKKYYNFLDNDIIFSHFFQENCIQNMVERTP